MLTHLLAAIQVPKLVSAWMIVHLRDVSRTRHWQRRAKISSPFHARLGTALSFDLSGENLLVSGVLFAISSADLGKGPGCRKPVGKTFFFVAREARPIVAKSLSRFTPSPPSSPTLRLDYLLLRFVGLKISSPNFCFNILHSTPSSPRAPISPPSFDFVKVSQLPLCNPSIFQSASRSVAQSSDGGYTNPFC